ncbi:MAG: hypothetical protein DRJ42_26975 [Deltaproteobacteria bacterium]|nr:MAG: hypothetical protein DRJ42_26975 [Deltaproteobacteria bacterium]
MTNFNGIDLDRYAQLAAVVGDTQDPNEQARLVGAEGVNAADWEAAKAGWTAKMQDVSDMGQTATQYMALYNGYLAQRRGGQVTASFEDYVAMSAVVKARGYEGMIAAYGISQADWMQIANHWNTTMGAAPQQYGHFHGMVDQESQRIAAGGQPRPVSMGQAALATPMPGAGAPAAFGGQAPVQAVAPHAAVAMPMGAVPGMAPGANPYAKAQGALASAGGQLKMVQFGLAGLGAFGVLIGLVVMIFASFVTGLILAVMGAVFAAVAWFQLPTFMNMVSGSTAMVDQLSANHQLGQTGIPAKAKILSIQQTGTMVNMNPQVQCVLEVQGAQGPYQVQTMSVIPQMRIPQFQPGAVIDVRVDPANPQVVSLAV